MCIKRSTLISRTEGSSLGFAVLAIADLQDVLQQHNVCFPDFP